MLFRTNTQWNFYGILGLLTMSAPAILGSITDTGDVVRTDYYLFYMKNERTGK